jgi:cytochrome bd-type quinol oxidase subunit 2
MSTATKLERLRTRNALALRATIAVFGLALLAGVAILAHVETGSGPQINDVHLPANWLVMLYPSPFAPGEPYAVGSGMSKVVQWLVLIVFAGVQITCVGFLIWALRKKRRQLIVPTLALFVIADLLTPVPKVVVAGTARAVSVETAERMLSSTREATVHWHEN